MTLKKKNFNSYTQELKKNLEKNGKRVFNKINFVFQNSY